MAADAETVPVGDEMMASKNEVDRPEDAIAAVGAGSAPSGGETTAAAETADLPGGSSASAPQGDGTSEKCDDKVAEKEAVAANSGACAAEAGAAATEHGPEEPSTSEAAPLEAPAEKPIAAAVAEEHHQEPVDPTVMDAAAAQGAETRTDQAGDQADKGSLEAGPGVPAALAIDPDGGGGGGKVTAAEWAAVCAGALGPGRMVANGSGKRTGAQGVRAASRVRKAARGEIYWAALSQAGVAPYNRRGAVRVDDWRI